MTLSDVPLASGESARAPLLVALGSPDRGDDAVGAAIARAVRTQLAPGVRVVDREDPTTLLDTWTGHDPVVVVDAVCSGAAPGTVHRLVTGAGDERLPTSTWSGTGRGGTHAIGLATTVELARVLRRLPDRLVLVGVEAAGFEHGAPLTPAVAAAVDRAAHTVLAELAGPDEGSPDVPG